MPIPDEILAVERPKNTRVKAGPKGTYYVIARTCIYKNGRNVPKELGVVGRIIDGKYVPNPVKKDENIDIKKYGTVALFHKAGSFGGILIGIELSASRLIEPKTVPSPLKTSSSFRREYIV